MHTKIKYANKEVFNDLKKFVKEKDGLKLIDDEEKTKKRFVGKIKDHDNS